MFSKKKPEVQSTFINECNGAIFNLLVLDSPITDGQPLGRMFTAIGLDEDFKKTIVDNLMADTRYPLEKRDAAVILFNLFDVMPYRRNNADAYQDIINVIQDQKLTIAYANRILLIVCKTKPYLVRPEKQGLVSSYLFPAAHSSAWQNTMTEIRKIALAKLTREVEALMTNEQKLSLLEMSKKMQIFCEHQSNYFITGAYGRTDAVIAIDALINKIKSCSPNEKSNSKKF